MKQAAGSSALAIKRVRLAGADAFSMLNIRQLKTRVGSRSAQAASPIDSSFSGIPQSLLSAYPCLGGSQDQSSRAFRGGTQVTLRFLANHPVGAPVPLVPTRGLLGFCVEERPLSLF